MINLMSSKIRYG